MSLEKMHIQFYNLIKLSSKNVFNSWFAGGMVNNPLEQFVSVEERPDGVYIRVSRSERDTINLNEIVRHLDTVGVMNFEQQNIADVIQRGRGVFERIGPPFEYYTPEFDKFIQISFTPLKASVEISSACLASGLRPNIRLITYGLKRKGIVHGIRTEVIRDIVADSLYDKKIEVANGTPPKAGLNAEIVFNVEINPDSRPEIKSDGSVDYRSIRSFTSVAQGQILATKKPPTQGTPGIAVNGEPIPSTPGKDYPLPYGKNTEVSADGRSLIALKSGIVFEDKGLINIIELLHVRGNVDFTIGNIKYGGDVLVDGNVLPGFSVESEGSIHIRGDVEAARVISRNGSVLIDKGVLGKGECLLKAKAGIEFSFAQECKIECDGIVFFRKYMMHCTTVCESIEGKEGASNLIGGLTRAEKFISVYQLGTDKGVKTKIELFDKRKSAEEEKLKELAALETKLLAEAAPIEKQIRTKAIILRKSSAEDITDRHKDEVKKWVDAYNGISMKVKYVREKIEELKIQINAPKTYDGFIRVKGITFPGVDLNLYGFIFPVNNKMTSKKFTIKTDRIETEDIK